MDMFWNEPVEPDDEDPVTAPRRLETESRQMSEMRNAPQPVP
jgi:hypothetical protein